MFYVILSQNRCICFVNAGMILGNLNETGYITSLIGDKRMKTLLTLIVHTWLAVYAIVDLVMTGRGTVCKSITERIRDGA